MSDEDKVKLSTKCKTKEGRSWMEQYEEARNRDRDDASGALEEAHRARAASTTWGRNEEERQAALKRGADDYPSCRTFADTLGRKEADAITWYLAPLRAH